jgi:hypothetical protein
MIQAAVAMRLTMKRCACTARVCAKTAGLLGFGTKTLDGPGPPPSATARNQDSSI